jgi:hypothetical protein
VRDCANGKVKEDFAVSDKSIRWAFLLTYLIELLQSNDAHTIRTSRIVRGKWKEREESLVNRIARNASSISIGLQALILVWAT